MVQVVEVDSSAAGSGERVDGVDAEPRAFRVVDLFAGCGGLSFGFSRANNASAVFEHVAAVEMNKDAAQSFAANVDERVFRGDISEWLGSDDMPDGADVILGGPPCQGFSALGKQDVADERNKLWERYVEAVSRLQPQFFVLENVREFLTSPQATALRSAIGSGGKLTNYAIEEFVLDASEYGSPQKRKRAIVIGRRLPHEPLGEPLRALFSRTVRGAFSELSHEVKERDLPDRVVTVDGEVLRGPFSTSELHLTRKLTQLSIDRFEKIPPGGNRFHIPDELLSPCWRKHTSGSGDVMGRMHWFRPSVTIRTEFFKPEKGRYLHPEADRPITHHEAARLQGFPDDFQWYGSKVSIARQIGNAVPIDLAAALGAHIMSALCSSAASDS